MTIGDIRKQTILTKDGYVERIEKGDGCEVNLCCGGLQRDVLTDICAAAMYCGLRNLILFGSRARGDHWERSDIDLAARFDSADQYFAFEEALNMVPTLLMFDIVDLRSDMIDPNLRDAIDREGVTIYKKIIKAGIMQPYFFPYIGYWQLMNAVDQYVIFDDVNYINRGWINRNRILANGQPQYFNLPCIGCSQNKLICEIETNTDEKEIRKKLRQIELSYKRAPYFKEVYPLIEKIMTSGIQNLAQYLRNAIGEVCSYIGITTELILSSEIEKDQTLRAQHKILDICRRLGASEYYNAIGGTELYDRELFTANGIDLKFVKTGDITYKQFEHEFVPGLSIIDVLMFNSVEETRELLENYTLVEGE